MTNEAVDRRDTDPSLHQLTIFDAVMRHGTITAAAEAVNLTQPVVSRTVASIERKFGWTLFERSSTGMHATPTGQAFASAARRILQVRRETMRGFHDYLDDGPGSISIATVPSVAASILPLAVRDLRMALPEVRVQIYDSTHADVVRDVNRGTADIGVSGDQGLGRELRVRRALIDPYFALLPGDHPYSDADALELSELANQPFIFPGQGSLIRQQLNDEFKRLGRAPSIVLEANHVAAVAGLVAAGLGVSAVPDLVRKLIPTAQTSTVPLQSSTRRVITSFWRGEAITPTAQRFLDILHRQLNPEGVLDA